MVGTEAAQGLIERPRVAGERLHEAEAAGAVPVAEQGAVGQVDHVLGVEGIDGVGAPPRAVQGADRRPDRQPRRQIAVAGRRARRHRPLLRQPIAGVEPAGQEADDRQSDRDVRAGPAGDRGRHRQGERRQHRHQVARVRRQDQEKQRIAERHAGQPAHPRLPPGRRHDEGQPQEVGRRARRLQAGADAGEDDVPRQAHEGAQALGERAGWRLPAGGPRRRVRPEEPAGELWEEREERVSRVVKDAAVPGREHGEGDQGGHGDVAAPSARGRRRRRRQQGEEEDRADEEEPQVLDRRGRGREEGGESEPAAPSPRVPPALARPERRGGEEGEPRLDVGGAGEVGDERVAQPDRRRQPPRRRRERPSPPAVEERRGEQRGEQLDQVRGHVAGEEEDAGEQHLAVLREDGDAQHRQEGDAAGPREGARERQVIEGLVEAGRRIEGENEERRHDGCDPQNPERGEKRPHPRPLSLLETPSEPEQKNPGDDRHDREDDPAPQQPPQSEQEPEMAEESEAESRRHRAALHAIVLVVLAVLAALGVQAAQHGPPGHPGGSRQRQQGQQVAQDEEGGHSRDSLPHLVARFQVFPSNGGSG